MYKVLYTKPKNGEQRYCKEVYSQYMKGKNCHKLHVKVQARIRGLPYLPSLYPARSCKQALE